ncbi:hypothetical protein BDB01DRAFT_855422 [Pilobolus umbonatus]|nr:hypothetical protein BDB01DRAFT_855422 [Pilobolus umbonatus]
MTPKSKNKISDDEVYEVEALVGHRLSETNNKVLEYLIKWKNYDSDSNTWEREKNVFAHGLINEYWNKQPYSRSDFLKTEKKKTVKKTSHSPVTPDSTQENAHNGNPSLQTPKTPITKAQLSAAPPKKNGWDDIEYITNIFHCGNDILFAEIVWKNHKEATFIPTRLIRKYNPLKLIEFYENNIVFSPPSSLV